MKNRFYGFIRGLLYVPYKLIYPSKIVARENMPKNARVITVSNHLSWLDIPTIAIYIPGYRHFIAKKEIGNKEFIRKLALKLGVIFVDRGKADMAAIRECVRALKANEGLSIFPEGTRNKSDENLHEVKGGVTMLALKGESPIVPILIHHRSKAFRKNYVYVGEPFDLSAFKNRRLDADAIAEASEIVAEHMQLAKDYLDDYVQNKRWIEIKAQKKARRKELKKLNRQAKKDYVQFKRENAKRKAAQKKGIV